MTRSSRHVARPPFGRCAGPSAPTPTRSGHHRPRRPGPCAPTSKSMRPRTAASSLVRALKFPTLTQMALSALPVGFGDITPTADSARIVVSIQMILDPTIVGRVVRVLFNAAQTGRKRAAAGSEETEQPTGSSRGCAGVLRFPVPEHGRLRERPASRRRTLRRARLAGCISAAQVRRRFGARSSARARPAVPEVVSFGGRSRYAAPIRGVHGGLRHAQRR
jgi:hypothetical protein